MSTENETTDLPSVICGNDRELIRRMIRREVQEALSPLNERLQALSDATRAVCVHMEDQARDIDTLNSEVDFLRLMTDDLLQQSPSSASN
jgi:hypothetical protein